MTGAGSLSVLDLCLGLLSRWGHSTPLPIYKGICITDIYPPILIAFCFIVINLTTVIIIAWYLSVGPALHLPHHGVL